MCKLGRSKREIRTSAAIAVSPHVDDANRLGDNGSDRACYADQLSTSLACSAVNLEDPSCHLRLLHCSLSLMGQHVLRIIFA